jgi:TatD DNase family protein
VFETVRLTDSRLLGPSGLVARDLDGDGDVDFAVSDDVSGGVLVLYQRPGLDFFKEYSPRAAQEANLRWHLELARQLDKPVILHCRDAHERMVAILCEHAGVRGVMHCDSMGQGELPPDLELGLYISFSGMVTYPKNTANRAAAAAVPLERLLVETDSPFLAPQSKRGQRNEPALVVEVLEELGRTRPEPAEVIAEATGANAAALFGLA